MLLPSGPDTVRGSPLRGTRSSTSHRRAATENGDLERGFGPAGADCRLQGTASSPPSTAREGYRPDQTGSRRPSFAVVAEEDLGRIERAQALDRAVVGGLVPGAAPSLERVRVARPLAGRVAGLAGEDDRASRVRRRPGTGGRPCGPASRRPGCRRASSWSPAICS